MKRWLFFVTLSASILYFLLSSFLQYSSQPFKADAIILLVGYDNEAREAEAKRLLHEGYADYLLIPAWNKVLFKHKDTGVIDEFMLGQPVSTGGPRHWIRFGVLTSPENTHIEVLRAKGMMEALGLKTALFVSSPHHLRRIKMMAQAEFGDEVKMAFVAADVEKNELPGWKAYFKDLYWLGMESVKIVWFLIYDSLSRPVDLVN